MYYFDAFDASGYLDLFERYLTYIALFSTRVSSKFRRFDFLEWGELKHHT